MISTQIAKHFRDIHFGGNWSTSCYREHLNDISLQQAMQQIAGMNSIATLTYHTHYYTAALLRVLNGEGLQSKDAYSFILPEWKDETVWQAFLQQVWDTATQAADLIETLPDSIWEQAFTDEKYGSYYRNICGMTEHLHYHLGQIVCIKKLLTSF